MTSKEHITEHDGKLRRHRVGCYVFNLEGLLLSYYKLGESPDIPGGGIDKDEDIVTAAIRETMEESGWLVKDAKLVTLGKPWLYENTKLDNKWFTGNGWHEELEYAVTCTAVAFKPNKAWEDSVDKKVFTFNQVSEVIESTKKALELGNLDSLRSFHLTYMLEILQNIRPYALSRPLVALITTHWQ